MSMQAIARYLSSGLGFWETILHVDTVYDKLFIIDSITEPNLLTFDGWIYKLFDSSKDLITYS